MTAESSRSSSPTRSWRLCATPRDSPVNSSEPFITTRTLLVALLEDPTLGRSAGRGAAAREARELRIARRRRHALTASRVPEPNCTAGERRALLRFNTLAFKVPDGSKSVWLSREAHKSGTKPQNGWATARNSCPSTSLSALQRTRFARPACLRRCIYPPATSPK